MTTEPAQAARPIIGVGTSSEAMTGGRGFGAFVPWASLAWEKRTWKERVMQ
jgi:hypothetical protein